MKELPPELGDAGSLIKRYNRAGALMERWHSHLSDCFRFTAPNRDTFLDRTAGESRHKEIFDDTALTAAKRYVSRMIATIMPTGTEWSLLKPGADYEESPDADQISDALEQLTTDMFRYVNHSNFYQVLPEAMRDMTVSTGAMKIEPGTLDKPFRCTAETLSVLRFEEGPDGSIENVWRSPKVRIGVLDRLYPGIDIPAKWRKKVTETPDWEPDLIEGSLYAPKAGVYVSFLIAKSEKQIIWSQVNGKGPGANPWIVFREDKIPGEILGRGPAMSALPSIMSANKVAEFSLRNGALAVAGMWTGVADGVLNPYTARVKPGIILPVGSNSAHNPALRALERSGDFSVGELLLTGLQENIKLAFLNSLRRAAGPVKSATEIAIDDRDLMMEEHASFGRLTVELPDKCVQRFLFIMEFFGLAPAIKVDGREVTIKHTSPLARVQDAEDLNALARFMELCMNTAGPEVTGLRVKVEEIPEYLAKLSGVPISLIRDDGEVQQITENAQAALAAQQPDQQVVATQ